MSLHFSLSRWVRTLLLVPVLAATAVHAADLKVLKVGTRSGPGELILEEAAKVLARDGIKLEPVVIDGIVSPNEALNNGDINANAFQHQPFLNQEIKNRQYKIVSVAKTYNAPLAIYSVKHKSLAQLPVGARISIPDDSANQSRALLAFQDHGLIKLRPNFDLAKDSATPDDIVDNPKKLKFVELSLTVIPRTFQDVDAGAINSTHAFRVAKLTLKDAIAIEKDRTQNYTSVIAVRIQDKDQPWVAQLVKAYRSPEVKKFIEKEFDGQFVAAW